MSQLINLIGSAALAFGASEPNYETPRGNYFSSELGRYEVVERGSRDYTWVQGGGDVDVLKVLIGSAVTGAICGGVLYYVRKILNEEGRDNSGD